MRNGVRAKIVERREDRNQLTHKLAYISGRSGEEWVDVDEKQGLIRNQSGNMNVCYAVKEAVKAGTAHDGEGGFMRGVSFKRGVPRCVVAVRDQARATVRRNLLAKNEGYGLLVGDEAEALLEEPMGYRLKRKESERKVKGISFREGLKKDEKSIFQASFKHFSSSSWLRRL